MILVDASVWINHLRTADERLAALLDANEALGHPFVLGELALGSLHQRESFMRAFRRLPQVDVASDSEVVELIERHALFGRGIGYVDAHLLAAVRLTSGARLWTQDRRLQTIAAELGVAAGLPH